MSQRVYNTLGKIIKIKRHTSVEIQFLKQLLSALEKNEPSCEIRLTKEKDKKIIDTK
jgi:hypothetical protein